MRRVDPCSLHYFCRRVGNKQPPAKPGVVYSIKRTLEAVPIEGKVV